jgi:hypothetical protein
LVLDLGEEGRRFSCRGFSEGDDTYFFLELCVCDRDRYNVQQPQGDEAPLAVVEPLIFDRERQAREHPLSIDQVQPVSLEVSNPLLLNRDAAGRGSPAGDKLGQGEKPLALYASPSAPT